MTFKHILANAVRRYVRKKRAEAVAKNSPKKGHSMRNGNAPSPYTKYNKAPYIYSFKSKKVGENQRAYTS